ncbi:PTS sugar transporter subunit IIA [Bifidobacterium sp. ESL0775]|uniref:PTS sugar transporter subunit IIA n=1 Tax=Bifidobacterium sp. ESL0775 TaxID=2983230 RepID=UPI0023F85D91|nr:PTS sugar transporter subunit IIA [Bifidobacterium sp. ESL0775]WEV68764.1 PTS sugar transporter subunit IIA [Bifidobacterium sp. ESL0775]
MSVEEKVAQARHVQLNLHVNGWQEALSSAAQPLVDDGSIDPSYVQGMVDAVNKLGPYIVLAPGFALGHARPSAAVHRTCFSLATLAEPVEFGNKENDPVDIVAILAATGDDAHIQMLQKIVTFLNAGNGFAMLRGAETEDDIQAIVNKINEGE